MDYDQPSSSIDEEYGMPSYPFDTQMSYQFSEGCSQANLVAQQALIAHWQSIVKSLNYYLKIMKANHVIPPFLVRKVFTRIFSFINVRLFNGNLLLRHECCSFSNGEFVKTDWLTVGFLVLYRTQTGFSKLEKRTESTSLSGSKSS
ncbi:hypothetical protein AAG906_025167 [Vitis piasezkii]